MPIACSPLSMARKRTKARWAESSARNSRPGWSCWSPLRWSRLGGNGGADLQPARCEGAARHIALAGRCAPIRVMSEIQAFGNRAPLRHHGVRTVAWMFLCCLLVHGTGGPGYSQTDSIPQRPSPEDTFRVRVVGTTNTQAVLAWSAPDSNPCSVQVSESNSLSPLVHDVDATLFTGADSDART